MEFLPQMRYRRGCDLLTAHLGSLDLGAPRAQERLRAELGSELTRKLLFALAPHRPGRRAA
jgi:hypothetical protein